MFNDAAKQFESVLRTDSRIPPINFRMPQGKVDYRMFLRVADALKNDDIRVGMNARLPTGVLMGYDRAHDVIAIPTAYDRLLYESYRGKAHVVHEAVHAASDLDKLKLLRLHDEAAAHLATHLYYVYAGARDEWEEEAYQDREGDGRIAVECFQMIDRFGLTQSGAQFVPADACNRLADVIARQPAYNHLRGKFARNNGVQGGLVRTIGRLTLYASHPEPRQREGQ